jgi:pyruvate/2-oxoglutarate dehydrogenase complex dihydrolipoamide dehydrogenase (E3) component
MPASFDVIVIGAGSGGVACATALASGGKQVAVIERERVGGECAFWACLPSKVLLRSSEPNAQSATVPGSRDARSGVPAFSVAAAWRTSMVDDYRDAEHASELTKTGVTLLRGNAMIVDRERVRVNDTEYRYKTLVVATGSEDAKAPVEGLADAPFWTTRDATSASAVPNRLIFLGGGAASVELAQVYARYGSRVTVVETAARILIEEDPGAAELIAKALENDGVVLRVASKAKQVEWHDGTARLSLDSGETIEADRLCVATGRTMRTDGFGLENTGATITDGCLVIDETCRAAENVYAVGDVTGKALFTHVAKYQARIAAAAILGSPAKAHFDAIPRCVYTSPELAATGITREQAAKKGLRLKTARVTFDEITRPAVYSDPPVDGALELFANASTGAIAGGWMVGPTASETIGFITSAIRTAAPLANLLDVIQPYPTFSEALYVALDRLAHA